MKIAPSTILPFNRESAKPASLRENAAAQAADSAKPTRAVDQSEQKTAPPGLERVLARLQSVPVPDRNAGQANATDRISRNIARYAETQAISTPPAEPSNTTDSAAPPVTTPI